MDRERQRRIRDLFVQALELDEAERRDWLHHACADDPSLIKEVMGLLAPGATGFLDPPMMAQEPEDLIGIQVGEFQLLDILGSGGMGVVYRARQSHPKRDVAVKVLRQLQGKAGAARFQVEIQAMAKFDHPGIVRILASGVQGELRWYAMDLVDGWSLQELMQFSKNPKTAAEDAPKLDSPRACVEMVIQLLEGLQHAHENQVFHRDVKPGNIMVDRSGRARLSDFGLARDLEMSGVSRTGEIAGTLAYMSPEQASSIQNAVDARSDLYSASAVLYELLSGKPLYEADTAPAVLSMILQKEPTPLLKRVPSLDKRLAAICSIGIRRQREDRYPNAQAMADDLARWLRGEKIQGHAMSLAERVRSRSMDRRFLLRAIPVAGIVGGGLAIGIGSWIFSTSDPICRIKLTLDPSDEGAQLVLQSTDGISTLTPAVEVGTYRGGTQELTIPAGWGRLTAISGAKNVAFDREFVGELELLGRCSAMPISDLAWARVAGALTDVTVTFQLAKSGEVNPYERSVQVDPFWISRACISQGEYEEAAREMGQWSVPPQEEDLLKIVAEIHSGKLGVGYDLWRRLPAMRNRLVLAQRFAEWHGHRLPTSAEWKLAALAGDPMWTERASVESFVLGKLTEGAYGNASTIENYLAHVRPVDESQFAQGPLGLFHIFGNVAEWTSSPAPLPSDKEPLLTSAQVATRGQSWFHSSSSLVENPFDQMGYSSPFQSDLSIGFRCVKAASPF